MTVYSTQAVLPTMKAKWKNFKYKNIHLEVNRNKY